MGTPDPLIIMFNGDAVLAEEITSVSMGRHYTTPTVLVSRRTGRDLTSQHTTWAEAEAEVATIIDRWREWLRLPQLDQDAERT